jgi:uncharacterized protein involved in response to NO
MRCVRCERAPSATFTAADDELAVLAAARTGSGCRAASERSPARRRRSHGRRRPVNFGLDRQAAYELFYSAAAAYAALVLPVSVLAMTGTLDVLPALADPQAHAHEMLLGFALAVVAGNQLGVARGRYVVALLLLWCAARAAFVFAPAGVPTAALNAAFATLLGVRVVPRLLGSAKKWRNRALPGVLSGLCAGAICWQVVRHSGYGGSAHRIELALVLLFATLMLFMGGRLTAPAIAGQLHRQGIRLQARVQPRIEGALLLSAGLAAALATIPAMTAATVAAAAVAGALALVRMARWRLWAVRGRPDLLCLGAGYGWLCAGLLALGAALAAGRYQTAAIHLITVGALGTLTFTVMATLWLAQSRSTPARSPSIVWGTAALAASAVFRALGAIYADSWLIASAACWTLAFVLLLALFGRHRRARRPGED